jgi:hypothetical protein
VLQNKEENCGDPSGTELEPHCDRVEGVAEIGEGSEQIKKPSQT